MERRLLGNTGISVSRLCFGTLTISRLQKNFSVGAGGRLMAAAIASGVNFFDSAELYGTYKHIGQAMKLSGNNGIVVAGKSYASEKLPMLDSLHAALREINRDYIDIFLLHEQESIFTLRGHSAALEALVAAKQAGKIRAVGISTHFVNAVKSAALLSEIDVIHPLINQQGIGIRGGTVDEMLQAIAFAVECGKGIYAMKVLAGGHLVTTAQQSLTWALEQNNFSSIAVGMQDTTELEANCRLFSGIPANDMFKQAGRKKRQLKIHDWCRGCGACVQRCRNGALEVVNGKAVVDDRKCSLCAYCADVCEEFCIKVC